MTVLGLVGAILLVNSTSQVSAAVYKWTDKEGNVHFSQKPQDADSAQKTYDLQYKSEQGKSYPDSGDKKPAEKGQKSPDAADMTPEERVAALEKSEQEAAKKAEEATKVAADKKANCEKAQKRMAIANQGGRVYEVDKNGERAYWDDSTRKAKQAEAQGFVDTFCSDK